MIGWFDEDKIKKLLQIPSDKSIGLVISAGYAVDGYPQRTKIRKTREEFVSFNKYLCFSPR
jgi:nitroreductase